VKLRVVAPDATGRDAKIFLDDKELKGCVLLDVSLKANEPNYAVIEFVPTELEIEGDFEIETKRHEFSTLNPSLEKGCRKGG